MLASSSVSQSLLEGRETWSMNLDLNIQKRRSRLYFK